MDNSLEGLLEEWQYVRGLTKCFIKKLSNDNLDKKLPRNNLDTIRKQCEELLEVQLCYIEALDTGIIKFEGYKDSELPGNTSKNNLLERCDELDSLLINKIKELKEDETISWFGEEKSVQSHLAAMISHESMHLGQIVGFCYATEIQIPKEIIHNMSLSS